MQKMFLLTGVMAIAAAGAPAFAEISSTPSELAQTRALNKGAQTGTYVTADALNGNPTDPIGVPDPPFGRPAQPSAFGPNGASVPPALLQKRPKNSDDFIALETVDPDRLTGDEVQTTDGMAVGRVRDVKLGPDGASMVVAIELNDGRDVRVPQESLKFNPSANVVLSNMDVNEMLAASDEDARMNSGPGDRHAQGPGDKPMSGIANKPQSPASTGQP